MQKIIIFIFFAFLKSFSVCGSEGLFVTNYFCGFKVVLTFNVTVSSKLRLFSLFIVISCVFITYKHATIRCCI